MVVSMQSFVIGYSDEQTTIKQAMSCILRPFSEKRKAKDVMFCNSTTRFQFGAICAFLDELETQDTGFHSAMPSFNGSGRALVQNSSTGDGPVIAMVLNPFLPRYRVDNSPANTSLIAATVCSM